MMLPIIWGMTLCAQVPAQMVTGDPLTNTGAVGWAGAVTLSGVLSWLLFVHIPAKDKQLKDFVDGKDHFIKELIDNRDKILEGKDAQIRTLIEWKDKALEAKDVQIAGIFERKWQMIQELATGYKESLKEVTNHCEKEVSVMTEKWGRDIAALTGAVQDLSEYLQDKKTA